MKVENLERVIEINNQLTLLRSAHTCFGNGRGDGTEIKFFHDNDVNIFGTAKSLDEGLVLSVSDRVKQHICEIGVIYTDAIYTKILELEGELSNL